VRVAATPRENPGLSFPSSDAKKRDLLDTNRTLTGFLDHLWLPCNRRVTPERRREELFRLAYLASQHPPRGLRPILDHLRKYTFRILTHSVLFRSIRGSSPNVRKRL